MKDPVWMDAFLFWDCVIVSALIFVDFLMGEGRRQAIRDHIGKFGAFIAELSIREIVQTDARQIANFYSFVFGGRVFSLRFIGSALLFALLSVALCTYSYFSVGIGTPREKIELSVYLLLSVVPAAVFSFGCTFFVLRRLSVYKRFPEAFGLLCLDLFAAWLAASIASHTISAVLGTGLTQLDDDPFEGLGVALYAALGGFLPSVPHLSLMLVTVGYKLVGTPVLKLCELLFIAISESKKGVLTLVSGALGVVAKLLQLYLGAYGS